VRRVRVVALPVVVVAVAALGAVVVVLAPVGVGVAVAVVHVAPLPVVAVGVVAATVREVGLGVVFHVPVLVAVAVGAALVPRAALRVRRAPVGPAELVGDDVARVRLHRTVVPLAALVVVGAGGGVHDHQVAAGQEQDKQNRNRAVHRTPPWFIDVFNLRTIYYSTNFTINQAKIKKFVLF